MPLVNVEDRLCVLYKDGKAAELHYFSLPETNASWGFTIRSMSAYNQRERKLWCAAQDKGKQLPRKGEIYFPQDLEQMPYLKHLPAFSHNTLWDMYTAIGYNYKTKKYV